MRKTCISCKGKLLRNDQLITGGICKTCISSLVDCNGESWRTLLNGFDAPLLLMQPEPRRVRTANKNACALFGKDLSRIEGSRGGEVFDCEYAFTELGCGLDDHCRECRIRNTIVETFKTGKSFAGVSGILTIKRDDKLKHYSLTISTESIGDLALVRIDLFRSMS